VPDSIPPHLSEAFRKAVYLLAAWNPPEPESTVLIEERTFTMSAVFGAAENYRDPLPDFIFDKLRSYMHAQDSDLEADLADDPSYATGARCLVKLIGERKAAYKLRNAWRGGL
jgi:hypothetical protein